MPQLNDIIVDPISNGELERRWTAVRARMEERGIDVLVMQSNNSCLGGYIKWFSDIPALYGYYGALLFPQNERMIAFRHGPHQEIRVADGDPLNRGIGKIVTRPALASVNYTRDYHGEATVEELRRLMPTTIGLVNTQTMAYPYLEKIKSAALPNVCFVDATDLVDEIKAIKSEEEIDFIKRAAAMQDVAMEAVLKQVEPGKRVSDLAALAQYVGETMGSFDGLFLAAGGPVGTPAPKAPRHLQNHVLKDGDQFTLLIENNGPNGYYCEIGRTFVIGKAPQHMLDEFDFVLAAQRFTLNLMKPGADPRHILSSYNAFMKENGRPEETRLYAHGQGHDLVERPLFFPEETMKLAAGMNIAVHPTYVTTKDYSWVCDNYLITDTGVSESLHKTPQKIFEV